MNNAERRQPANDELKSLTERISDAIHRGKFTAAELQAVLAKSSKKAAEKTDDLVHEFPWTAVGVGVGLGLLAGVLAARAARSSREPQVQFNSDREPDEADTNAGSSPWDKFQTILPVAVLALKTFQEFRNLRSSRRL